MKTHGETMPTSIEVFPVLATTPYRGSIGEILHYIRGVTSSLLDYDMHIDQCFVTHIGHYRCTSNTSHELVALTMDYSVSDGTKETRYLRLDRTRDSKHDKGWLSMVSRDAVHVASSPCQSFDSNDSVYISDHLVEDTRGIMGKDYKLIRTFEVRSGTLPIIDALVLANTLSNIFERYTMHIQMCQFWAANLVLILKAVVEYRQNGDVTFSHGPALKSAGKFGSLQMVDINTGRALFGGSQRDLKQLFELKWTQSISPEMQAEANNLLATSTGGPIVAEVADQAPASNNDLTANTVYRTAQNDAAQLRQQIKDKLAFNLRQNAEIARRRTVQVPHNPAPQAVVA
ncbi:hypothetical protein BKA62DRAFT_209666 [Auriculariales sp. MPI-PUGE-AT-0066]|nr:hypothetical protein BKA62DRAFT_209666 [Auriculariales sp. MPI-PUGE-AT-0066]